VNGGNEDDFLAPYESTQEGIAKAVNITRAHASIELQRLGERGFVECLMRHINGLPTRRRTYRLTPQGYARVERLNAEVPVGIELRKVAFPAHNPTSPLAQRLEELERRLREVESVVLVEA